MTLEAFLLRLSEMDWLLGSLCQLAPNDWYVCLIDNAGYAHTATAASPIEAMEFALHQPATGRVNSLVPGVLVDKQGKRADRIDLASLGLIRRKEIDRRF